MLDRNDKHFSDTCWAGGKVSGKGVAGRKPRQQQAIYEFGGWKGGEAAQVLVKEPRQERTGMRHSATTSAHEHLCYTCKRCFCQ